MKLPQWATTVTPFSKALVLFIFITFPIIGFYLGMQYQKSLLIPIDRQPITESQQVKPNRLTLEIDGYGYTIGDIVQIKKGQAALGDDVVYNSVDNKSMCLAMGSAMSLGKIVGLPGGSVSFQNDGFKIGTELIKLDKDYSQQKAVFGGQKYNNLPINIIIKNGEYLLDKWVGFECFNGELDETGTSIPYNRFTVNEESIMGVIEKKIGHDNQAEKEFRNRIY